MVIFLLAGLLIKAQSPDGFNYQGVLRDSEGQLKVKSAETILIQLTAGPDSKEVLYEERHKITTSTIAAFDLIVGQGEVISGMFSEVDWGKGSVWLNVKIKNKQTG